MKDGILLEMLVELFQRMTASQGIKVERRRIFQIAKGDVAEVDVVVEGPFGSANMMVAVECRDRASPQGKDWIQQIIGKRDDLRRFGIRHWIAVSQSGFTKPAEDLARREGIDLLVPITVTPEVEAAPGPHKLLRFSLSRPRWRFRELQLTVSHEDETVLRRIESMLMAPMPAILFGDQAERAPAAAFFSRLADERREKESSDLPGELTVTFDEVAAHLEGIDFMVVGGQVVAFPEPEVIEGSCELLTFSDPSVLEFIGLIGLNRFNLDGDLVYLLAGIAPGTNRFVGLARTSRGEPIPGWCFTWYEHQLQAAGFSSRPPTTQAGSRLLHQLLQARRR